MWCVRHSARDSHLSSDADKSGRVPSTVPSSGPLYYDDSGRAERGVDLLPDPRHAGKNNGYSASGDSDTGGNVPQPLRVPKKRRSQPRAGQW